MVQKMQDEERARNLELEASLNEHMAYLEGRRDEVITRLRSLTRDDKLESDHGHGRAEDPTLAQRVNVFSQQINATIAALGRLSRGVYGICKECGDPISTERLKVVKFATRCTDCETDEEDAVATHAAEERVRRRKKTGSKKPKEREL